MITITRKQFYLCLTSLALGICLTISGAVDTYLNYAKSITQATQALRDAPWMKDNFDWGSFLGGVVSAIAVASSIIGSTWLQKNGFEKQQLLELTRINRETKILISGLSSELFVIKNYYINVIRRISGIIKRSEAAGKKSIDTSNKHLIPSISTTIYRQSSHKIGILGEEICNILSRIYNDIEYHHCRYKDNNNDTLTVERLKKFLQLLEETLKMINDSTELLKKKSDAIQS